MINQLCKICEPAASGSDLPRSVQQKSQVAKINNNPVHKKQQVVRVTSRMQFPSSLLGVAREVEMF